MLLRGMMAGAGIAANYLDDLSVQPRAVLSLRKLISTATNAIRVRRSSDNTEQDIGFSGNVLDTAALASFVGANSAYVTKVYDQAGNGEDLVQATAANQPRIVDAGTYDGKLVFNGTSHGMAISTLTCGTPYVGLYNKLALPGTYGAGQISMFELSPDAISVSGGAFVCLWDGTVWNTLARMTGGAVRGNGFNPSWASMKQASFLFDNTKSGSDEIKLFVAGVAQSGTVTQTGDQSGNYRSDQNLFVGARNNASLFCRLDLETMAIYNADTSAIRSSIEALVG